MRQFLALVLALLSGVTIGVVAGYYLTTNFLFPQNSFLSPFIEQAEVATKPLQKYSLANLSQMEFVPSPITIKEEIEKGDGFVEYLLTFSTMGRTMSGHLILPTAFALHPDQTDPPNKIIILIRGWADQTTYTTGSGTKPVARELAKQGYATLAPDFFGYGQSDPEPTNEWETRFVKPVNVIELYKSVQSFGVKDGRLDLPEHLQITLPATNKIGFWGHSNGGQVALTVLETLSQPIPTVLWAPVTAPFPYSILYFGNDLEDEGQQQRAWIAIFEKTYNALDFSLTQHLNQLTGPIQLHQGSADTDAPQTWNDRFAFLVEAENNKRLKTLTPAATVTLNQNPSQTPPPQISTLPPIDLTYFIYQGADHNLRPITHWNTAVSRDLVFFQTHL